MSKRVIVGLLLAAAFVGTIWAANEAVNTWQPWAVAGLLIPAGVWFIGPAFTIRDFLHETVGVVGVLVAIAVGALVSWNINPSLAFAASATFAVSELVDLAVYAPLRKKNWLGAVTASNVVGLVTDSVLFLWLAHSFFASIGINSWDLLPGQIVGKAVMTAVAVGLIAAIRGRQALEPATA